MGIDFWAKDRIEEMRARLARIGATQAEIDAFDAEWCSNEGWDEGEKHRLWALGDPQLREELLSARAGDLVDHETEAEEVVRTEAETLDAEEEARLAALDEEARSMGSLSMPKILAWVDGDLERAAAMREIEFGRIPPRTTLIAELDKIVDPPE